MTDIITLDTVYPCLEAHTHTFPLFVFCFCQSKLTKLNHEHRDLKEKLKEERKQIEDLWNIKTELEDERRLQDRAVEQLQRKVSSGSESLLSLP